ncbi:uncharacterized protein LOC130644887 [Hydractinia symbiolongicarpus]|uniref:uncharacterized protein LOC130644887 n=1 Tax=Hydractinia symbiolongicarpus TaxID=13093 RepID=UPI00254F9630|nr:uncharacterized protein LOC130644887 [Hydractinia symbiolongicarpus]
MSRYPLHLYVILFSYLQLLSFSSVEKDIQKKVDIDNDDTRDQDRDKDVFDRFYFVGENPLDKNAAAERDHPLRDIPVSTEEIRNMLQEFKKIEKENNARSEKHEIRRRSLNTVSYAEHLHSLRHRRDLESMKEVFNVKEDSDFEDLEEKKRKLKEFEDEPEEYKNLKSEIREIVLTELASRIHPKNEKSRELLLKNFHNISSQELYNTALEWGVIEEFGGNIFASKEVKHRHKRDFNHRDYELSFGDLNTETSYEVSHDDVNTFEDLQHGQAFNAASYQDVDPVLENLVFEDDDENKNAFDAEIQNPLDGIKLTGSVDEQIVNSDTETDSFDHVIFNEKKTPPLTSERKSRSAEDEHKYYLNTGETYGNDKNDKQTVDYKSVASKDDLFLTGAFSKNKDEITKSILSETAEKSKTKYLEGSAESNNTTNMNPFPSNSILVLTKKVKSLKEAIRSHPILHAELSKVLRYIEIKLIKKEAELKERYSSIQKGLRPLSSLKTHSESQTDTKKETNLPTKNRYTGEHYSNLPLSSPIGKEDPYALQTGEKSSNEILERSTPMDNRNSIVTHDTVQSSTKGINGDKLTDDVDVSSFQGSSKERDNTFFEDLTAEQNKQLSEVLKNWKDNPHNSNDASVPYDNEKTKHHKKGVAYEKLHDGNAHDMSSKKSKKNPDEEIFDYEYDNGLDKNNDGRENYVDDEISLHDGDAKETENGNAEPDVDEVQPASNVDIEEKDISYVLKLKSYLTNVDSKDQTDGEENRNNKLVSKEARKEKLNLQDAKPMQEDARERHKDKDGKYTSLLKTAELINPDFESSDGVINEQRNDVLDESKLIDRLKVEEDSGSERLAEFTPSDKPLKQHPPDQLIFGQSKRKEKKTKNYIVSAKDAQIL